MVNPFATAFLANTPAATITDGFEVFVQLVIAAMTTEPSAIEPGGTSGSGGGSFTPKGPDVGVDGGAMTSTGFDFAAPLSFGSTWRNAFPTSFNATRSCGRLGPARLDSTVARSSSSVSE